MAPYLAEDINGYWYPQNLCPIPTGDQAKWDALIDKMNVKTQPYWLAKDITIDNIPITKEVYRSLIPAIALATNIINFFPLSWQVNVHRPPQSEFAEDFLKFDPKEIKPEHPIEVLGTIMEHIPKLSFFTPGSRGTVYADGSPIGWSGTQFNTDDLNSKIQDVIKIHAGFLTALRRSVLPPAILAATGRLTEVEHECHVYTIRIYTSYYIATIIVHHFSHILEHREINQSITQGGYRTPPGTLSSESGRFTETLMFGGPIEGVFADRYDPTTLMAVAVGGFIETFGCFKWVQVDEIYIHSMLHGLVFEPDYIHRWQTFGDSAINYPLPGTLEPQVTFKEAWTLYMYPTKDEADKKGKERKLAKARKTPWKEVRTVKKCGRKEMWKEGREETLVWKVKTARLGLGKSVRGTGDAIKGGVGYLKNLFGMEVKDKEE